MIKEFKQSNFYYIFNIIIKNYLKLILFLIIGLIFGYLLHNNSERHLIIKKKISPLNQVNHVLKALIDAEVLMNDFIRANREVISKAEYDRMFKFDENSINDINKIPDLYNQRIFTNISYEKYLELSRNFIYLKERIDYEYNTYDVSKKITFKNHDKNFEEKKKNLKDDYNNYLWVTNQIIRKYFFNTVYNNPSFFRELVDIYQSDLIIVDNNYLADKLFEKNAKEIKKITKSISQLTQNVDNIIHTLQGTREREKKQAIKAQILIKEFESIVKQESIKTQKLILSKEKKKFIITKKIDDEKKNLKIIIKEIEDRKKDLKIIIKGIEDQKKDIKIIPKGKPDSKKDIKIITKGKLDSKKDIKIITKEIEDTKKYLNLEKERQEIQKELKKVNINAGEALNDLFKVSFKYSVHGLEKNFDIEIIEKNFYYYLMICSLISLATIINIIVIRDFIKNLKKN